MQLQYNIAVSIQFEHEYFSSGGMHSFQIIPCNETKHIFRKAGIAVRQFSDGMHVLFESDTAGTIRTRDEFLSGGWKLRFLLKNRDDSFFNYTAGIDGMDPSVSCFYFENDRSAQSGRLHTGDFVGKEAVRRLDEMDESYFIKPFGVITLHLHKGMAQNFSIAFSAASTYWCYVLTQSHLRELSNPAVISKDGAEVFIGPEPIRLPDNRPGLAFFSPGPIVHKERPDKYYQLVEEYNTAALRNKVVLPALPRPDKNHISLLKEVSASKGRNYSYVFV